VRIDGSRQAIIAAIAPIVRTKGYGIAAGVCIIPTRWTIFTPTIIAVPVPDVGVRIFTFGTIFTSGVTGIGFLTRRTSAASMSPNTITISTSHLIMSSTCITNPERAMAMVTMAMPTLYHVSRKSKIKNNEERINNKFHFYSMRSIYIYIFIILKTE